MKIIDLYVVVDNQDPYNGSRVRAYPLKNVKRTGDNPMRLLGALDTTGNYTPWEKAQTNAKINDPYCFEPFLPKIINIIPKTGDLIKVISYEDGENIPQEYLLVNSTVNNISTDTYRTADRFHINNNKRPTADDTRTRVPGFNPNYNDVGFLNQNSAVLLNDGRIILKSGYQTTSESGVKRVNKNQATINLHQFKNGYNFIDIENEITSQTRYQVNSIISYRLLDFLNDPYKINGLEFSFIFEIGIKMFDTPKFVENISGDITNFDVIIKLYFNNLDLFIGELKRLLIQFESKELDYIFGGDDLNYLDSSDLYYYVEDNRQPVGGVLPGNFLNMGSRFYIYQSQFQEYITETGVDLLNKITAIIQTTGGVIRPKLNGQQSVTEVTNIRKLNKTGFSETAIISGADRQFLLSWQDVDYNRFNYDEYIPQRMIYSKGGLLDTTEPLIRGNQFLIVLSKLIDLLLEHGHQNVSDSRNTIDKISDEKLNQIKTTILNLSSKEKQLKIDGGNINDSINKLINPNIRIN